MFESKMKKILVITYLFPPAGGVMVQRVLKFVKYLPHFGWQPTVLTVRNPDYRMFDPELLKDVPDQTEVIRTDTFEPSKIFKFFRSWFDKIKSTLFKEKTLAHKDNFDPTPSQSLSARISTFIFIPDNRVGWLPFAFFTMLKKLKKDKFDMIFSTSPPFSVHLIGLIAKLILKKPWVVDLRDLWVLNPHEKPATKVHFIISKYIEHKVFKIADRILTVSDPWSEALKKTYPDIVSEKFQVISNGYDANDFKMENSTRQNEKFSITHVGTLSMYYGRSPHYFLMALADLKNEMLHLKNRIEVSFIGAIDEKNKEIINSIASQFDLKDILRISDFISYHEAITCLKKSDVLLFLIVKSTKGCPSTWGNLPAKLYEYLAVGKPILALTEEDFTRDFIKKSGCGILVDYDDTKEIKEQILNCYNKFKKGRLEVKPNWDFITQFERKKLTQQLVNILSELSKNVS